MAHCIDNIVGTAAAPLLLNKGTFVELKGTLEILSHSFPKSRSETLLLRLKEAEGYTFRANIPVYAVNTIDFLYGAIGKEVIFKSKKNSSNEGEDGVTIEPLSCAYVGGKKLAFYNWNLLD